MSLPMFVGSVLIPPDGRDDRVTVLRVFADRTGSAFVRVRYRIQSARRPTDATPGEFRRGSRAGGRRARRGRGRHDPRDIITGLRAAGVCPLLPGSPAGFFAPEAGAICSKARTR